MNYYPQPINQIKDKIKKEFNNATGFDASNLI